MPPKIKGLTFAPGGHVPVKPKPKPKALPAPGHGNIAGPPLPAPGHGPIAGPPAPARRPTPAPRPAPRRRTAARARQPKITVADLLATDPFSSARRATRQRVNALRSTMPNRPELLSVPVLPHYTPRQRDIILREQAPRIQRIMRATGTRGNPRALLDTLNPHDALQVRIFAELAHQRSSPVSTDVRQRIARRMLAEGMSRSEVAQILAHPPTARPGRARGVLGSAVHVAGVDLPMALVGHDFSVPLAQIGDVGEALLVPELYRDSRDLIMQTPNSLYQLGAAGVGLAKYFGTSYPGARGHDSADLEPAHRVAQGLTEGFIGNVVRGRFRAAAEYAHDHPLFSYLEVSGAKALTGRSAGAAMRSGLLGPRARAAASMARTPLVDPYGRVLQARRYPADVLSKARIVAGERLDARRGRGPNVSQPSHVPYRGLRQASASMVDEYAAKAEGVRRVGRDTAMRRLAGAMPGRGRGRIGRVGDRLAPTSLGPIGDRVVPSRLRGRVTRPERDVLQAVVEGRVRPSHFAADLVAERDRLQAAYIRGTNPRAPGYEPMSGPARNANRLQVRALDRVLRSPRALANARGIAESAGRFKTMADRVEREAIRRGLLDPDQALAAKVRPYAVARMGARYDRRRTPPEHMAARYEQARQAERGSAVTVARARDAERQAGQVVGAARRELATARARAARVTGRAQLLAGQAERAGRAEPRRTLLALERERAAQLVAEHRLRGAVTALRTARADRRTAETALRAATRTRRGANPKRYVTGLVGRDGRRLATDEILAHMRANGIDLPAFVSHRMDTAGARSFFVNWFGRRQTLDGAGVRTGRATEMGAHGSSFPSLAEQHVRSQGVVDAVRNFDGFVRQFGVRRRDGEMFTWDEGQRITEDPSLIAARDSHGNPIPGYDELVPVRAVPARYSDATRRSVADLQDATRMTNLAGLVERRFAEIMEPPGAAEAGARNVVLVPRAELERFMEHQTKGSGAATRAGQVVSNAFRRTVLPFSVKWITGNTVEASLRLALVGVSPAWLVRTGRAYRLGARFLRDLEAIDANAAADLRARTLGGLLFGGGDRLIVHRTAESFRDSPALATPAGAAAVLRRTPVVKQTVGALKVYQDAVFRFNKMLEQQAQTAAIGKEARQQMHEMSGSWLAAQRAAGAAYSDLLRGARGTPNQVRFARYLDETLGKYSRFSPGMRRFIQGYAPFLPWYLNSYRFVLWTLPTKHPIKVAVATRLQQTFEEDFHAQHQGLPPGDLQAAVRLNNGGLLTLARFLPLGAFTDLPHSAADPVLPQFSSVIKAVEGRSFTGEQLRTSTGDVSDGDKVLLAANAMFEALVPGVMIARRVREGGSTAWDDSTIFSPKVKPGTRVRGGAARRILDPFRPVYLGGSGRKAAPRGGRSTAGSDGLDWSAASGAATGEALDWGAAVVGP